jgi:hypothetical protein
MASQSPSRYFAPSFFSAYYFPSLVNAAESASHYFAPSFFSPYYFPSLTGGPGGKGGVPDAPYRDSDAYAALVITLVSTGEFADVFFGTTAEEIATDADLNPVVVITPEEWSEFDDADPTVVLRHVFYTLTIIVRAAEPLARNRALDRLSCIAQNAIDGSDLGGGCLPPLTKLGRGRYEPQSQPPDQSVVLHGTFTYLIDSLTGHSTNY